MPKAPSILVGVAGGIAAYKAADVVSSLRKKGAQVTVLMTRNAGRFVSALVLKTLSGRPVGEDLFSEPAEWGVGHVTLAKEASAFVVVAATADLLAKLAGGQADDFVSAAALVYHPKALLLAPAMNTAMWKHPAVRANLRALAVRGAQILDPASGRLACGDVGDGKLPDPELIAERAWRMAMGAVAGIPLDSAAGAPGPLSRKRVLVSAGPTREALDPVRYLSNPSSGKMGYALAEACRDLGAEVTLVSGPVHLSGPDGVELVRVTTALEMLAACRKAFRRADAFIACAAVSDYRPAKAAAQKLKKTGRVEVLRLKPNPDILLTLGQSKGRRVLVGFAAETEKWLEHGADKLGRKRLDLLVANRVGQGLGFGADETEAWLLRPKTAPEHVALLGKPELARKIAGELVELLAKRA